MRFDPSTNCRGAQLQGWLDFMHLGAGDPYLELYEGPNPPAGPGTAPTGSVLLVSVPLPRPVGTVAAGGLTLAASDLASISNSGSAQWGRWYAGDGQWAGDCDVSSDAGTGFVRLADVTLFAGGTTQVMGGTIV